MWAHFQRAKMDKFLLVFLATVALVTSDEYEDEILVGSFELYSTPPSPPLPEGEQVLEPGMDPKGLLLRTNEVLGFLQSDLVVDEVFQLTHQLAQGAHHRFRSIFRATDGGAYKVVWTMSPGSNGEWRVDEGTLFHMPPEYPNEHNVVKSEKRQHETADEAFSTPPTPPKEGGERAQKPADTQEHREMAQDVLREAFDESDIIVVEVLLYTTQPISDGVQTRVIFKDEDEQLYKLKWALYGDHEKPQDVVGTVLFKLPPNYPTDGNIVLDQEDT